MSVRACNGMFNSRRFEIIIQMVKFITLVSLNRFNFDIKMPFNILLKLKKNNFNFRLFFVENPNKFDVII